MSDVSAGHREDRRSEHHPIEDHLAERFGFLDEDQRAMVIQIVKGYPVSERLLPKLEDLIEELALYIDAEAEWQRIERMSPDQVIAELHEAGVSDLDVSAGLERLGASLLARGIDISPEARERRFRQQEAWLDGYDRPLTDEERERVRLDVGRLTEFGYRMPCRDPRARSMTDEEKAATDAFFAAQIDTEAERAAGSQPYPSWPLVY